MDTERELLKGNTPTLVLAVLRAGPLHGYAIAREIERRSGETLRCREGTLYPVLHSLERDDLVRAEWRESDSGRRRKVYSLTPAGEAALVELTGTWTRFAEAVTNVLTGDGDAGTDPLPGRPLRRSGPLPEPG